MKRTVLAFIAAAALAACSGLGHAGSAEQPIPSSGADWRMLAQEDAAELVFGAGDLRALVFECRGGQDPELSVMAWLPMDDGPAAGARKPGEIRLRSAGELQVVPTLTEANAGRWEMMGHVRKNDPVVERFRASGSIELSGPGGAFAPLNSGAGNTAVADFFEWCH